MVLTGLLCSSFDIAIHRRMKYLCFFFVRVLIGPLLIFPRFGVQVKDCWSII